MFSAWNHKKFFPWNPQLGYLAIGMGRGLHIPSAKKPVTAGTPQCLLGAAATTGRSVQDAAAAEKQLTSGSAAGANGPMGRGEPWKLDPAPRKKNAWLMGCGSPEYIHTYIT